MHLTKSGEKTTSIQILDLKGLVNRKFETHLVLLSYSYLGAFACLRKKTSGNVRDSAWLPDAFCASPKNIWGFPISSKRGKFFQGVESHGPALLTINPVTSRWGLSIISSQIYALLSSNLLWWSRKFVLMCFDSRWKVGILSIDTSHIW